MSIVPHRHFLLNLPIAIFQFVINFRGKQTIEKTRPNRDAGKKKRVGPSCARAWWLRTLGLCRTAIDEIARRDTERRFVARIAS